MTDIAISMTMTIAITIIALRFDCKHKARHLKGMNRVGMKYGGKREKRKSEGEKETKEE